MKSKKILAVVVIAVAALLLSAGPVLAKAEKTDFTGTWCRTEVNPGTTTVLDSGRVKRKDGWAYFDVSSVDPRVAGEFYSYDVTFNLSAPIPVDGPVPANRREGLVHAKFILTPDSASGIDGTWEGWWKARYTIEDGWWYLTVTANGHGTGELDGSKISVDVKHEMYDLDCDDILEKDYPAPPFNGSILQASSAVDQDNLEFITEYFDVLSWQPKPPEVYEQYIDCDSDPDLCDHIDFYESICPAYGLDPIELVTIGDDKAWALTEFRCADPNEDPLFISLMYWIEGGKIVQHTLAIVGP